jgi:hypothetical protein
MVSWMLMACCPSLQDTAAATNSACQAWQDSGDVAAKKGGRVWIAEMCAPGAWGLLQGHRVTGDVSDALVSVDVGKRNR